MKDLSRAAKVMLWTKVYLEELEGLGLVSFINKQDDLTKSGKKVLKKIESEGFFPTQDEIHMAMDYFIEREGLILHTSEQTAH